MRLGATKSFHEFNNNSVWFMQKILWLFSVDKHYSIYEGEGWLAFRISDMAKNTDGTDI